MTTSGTINLENLKKSRIENFALQYPGSINNFRSLMDGFVAYCNKYWKIQNGLFIIVFYRPDLRAPGREVWDLRLSDKENGQSLAHYGATILAVESIPDKTKVSFLDGIHLGMFGRKKDFNDPAHITQEEKLGIGKSLILLSIAIQKEWDENVVSDTNLPPNANSMKISSSIYQGSVSNFRAWMDRFIANTGNIFSIPQEGGGLNEYAVSYLSIARNSTREVWYIKSISKRSPRQESSESELRHGMLLATEVIPGQTTFEFINGSYYKTRDFPSGALLNFRATTNEKIDDEAYLTHGNPIDEYDFVRVAQSIKSALELVEFKPYDSNTQNPKIDSIEYPVSVAHFRAWMDSFLARNGTTFKGTWEGHSLEYNIGYFTPAQTTTREVWNVSMDRSVINGKSPGDTHFAMILATEDQPNRTIVEFIDGQCYQRTSQPVPRSSSEPPVLGNAYPATHKPIGDNFIKIAKWITEGLNKNHMPSNFPKKRTTKVNTLKKRTEINLQTKPAGRKIDPWNLIAFTIMNDGDENAEIRAFNYWCEQQEIKNPGRDDRKNFKKAMKRMMSRQAE